MNKTIATLGIAGTLTFGGGVIVDEQINPYIDKDTHYELSVKSDIPQNDKVEITKDKPSVTISRWNDEERVTIEPKFRGVGKVSKVNRPLFSKKMEYKKGDVTAFVEPKTDTEFDIDFTLESKPTYNVFEYTITGAEDMDFFYQPELTQEEIEQGASRPDNVVGSYAVYSKTKVNHIIGKTNYGTGKLFHIYRPEAIDANGNRTWAVLDYKNGVLSVTIPQEFLDNAVYPVRVDPTFGYTTAGGTSGGWAANWIIGDYATTPADVSGATINSISWYGKTASNGNGKGVIALNSTKVIVANGITSGGSVTTTVQWNTHTFASSPSLSNSTVYLLGVITDQGPTIYYDSGGSNFDYYDSTNSYTTPTDPTGGSAGHAFNVNTSIYATYTADTPPAVTTATSTKQINNGSIKINNGRVILNN